MKKILLAVIMLVAVSAGANAALVMAWDFDPLAGGSGNFGPSPYTPSALNTHATSAGLIRNWTLGGGSGATNSWGGNNFNLASPSEASAIAAGNFASFSLTAETGYTLSFESISAYNIRRSSTGPTTGQWQYQIGSGSFVDIGGDITWGTTTSSTGNPQSAIDLSVISALQNIAPGIAVTFRVVTWGATTSGGVWYFNDLAGGTPANDLIINATVPEPSSSVLLLGGAAMVIWRLRSKRRAS